MEIKEAIAVLRFVMPTDPTGIVRDAYETAISALEKQEAKKPKYSEPFYDDVGCFAFDVSCPTCGKKLDVEDVCPECGQHIDWSEVDDGCID